MSKSLRRTIAALQGFGLDCVPVEMPGETRTAEQAAQAVGCDLDQIAKSIIFQGAQTGEIVLFLTAGGSQVDPGKAQRVAGQPLRRADADLVRSTTGFAIGGVAPIGHLTPIRAFWDPRLDDFATIWAAAGTPRHVFAVSPADLLRVTGAVRAEFSK